MIEQTEKGLVQATINTIIDCNLDTAIDIFETGLDELLNIDAIKELPIVKTAYGILNTGIKVREQYMLKKLLAFIKTFNDDNYNTNNYLKYKEKLKNNDRFALKELEYILIIIDRIMDINKTKILSNLYTNYINKNLSWMQFLEQSAILDNFFLYDISELKNIFEKKRITMNEIMSKVSLYRLKAMSLIYDAQTTFRSSNGGMNTYLLDYDYEISELGIIFYKYGILS